MRSKRGRPARRLDLEMTFSARTRTLPQEERRGLLIWLRQQRERPQRVFYEVNAAGELRRL